MHFLLLLFCFALPPPSPWISGPTLRIACVRSLFNFYRLKMCRNRTNLQCNARPPRGRMWLYCCVYVCNMCAWCVRACGCVCVCAWSSHIPKQYQWHVHPQHYFNGRYCTCVFSPSSSTINFRPSGSTVHPVLVVRSSLQARRVQNTINAV